jgi:predicted RND superfamily exporter protein
VRHDEPDHAGANGARAGAPELRRPFRLALGIERFGLVPLRFAIPSAIVFVLLAVLAAVGVMRIRADDSLSQLFRSDTPEFKQYEEVTRRFPSSEYDVLIVVEGKSLLERDSLEKLRDLVTELQLIDGTRGVVSLFSARQPPEDDHLPEPLFPDPLPEGKAYDALVQKVLSNEIIRGKLLSEDGQLALIVLALDPSAANGNALSKVVTEIRQTLAENIAGTGLKGELSGVPVMQLDIRKAMERDRVVYNALGFVAGCVIAIAFFRRVSFMVIAAGPPLTAILLALGVLGWLEFRLNIFLNVMTPLIMVISFSDSMQLTFLARDRLIAGHTKYEAFRDAILVAGPACVLTHATAGLSFFSLLFAKSELIRTFGEAGIIATVVALAAVLTLVPLLGVLLVHGETTFATRIKGADSAVDMLRRFCGWIAHRMVSRPSLYTLIAVSLITALGLVYANLQPRYRLADLVPDKEQAVEASGRLDAKLTGANPLDILIEFPPGASLYDPATLSCLAEVHTILEKQAGVGNVWSIETLRRWLAEKAGKSDVATLKQYIDILPPYLVRRFLSADQDAVVVSGRIPDKDASQLLPVVQSLDGSLAAVRAKYPGYRISVTGLSAIAARNSADMIKKLNYGLTIEIVFVAAFIGLAFRSWIVALAVIPPGIFPVLMSGDILWALGDGLQFASIVALTVSFGLALSATIHFLNRLRLEERPHEDPRGAVERATILVGPALILTSIVLACGLIATVLSDLPSLRLFGWLSAFAMISALVADMLILRPTIMFLRRLTMRLRGRVSPTVSTQ